MEVAFLFPGGGAQHLRMGRGLYRSESGFRAELDACAAVLRAREGFDLVAALYPEAGPDGAAAFDRARVAPPALVALEIALARFLMSRGVVPGALLGHSLGEYAAACVAGVLSRSDALSLVALFCRLFEALGEGAMMTVPLAEDDLRARLPGGVSIAAINTPSLCTVSGPIAAVEGLAGSLAREGVEAHRLHIPVAAHSAMLAPALDEIAAFARQIRPGPIGIPLLSNVTGTWMTAADAADPMYWIRHLQGAVRFSEGLSELCAMAAHYIAEIRDVRPRGPYLLGGGSMGGTVAFEMARQLSAAGEEVGCVAMFDTFGPRHFEFAPSDGSRPTWSGIAGRIDRRMGPIRRLRKEIERRTRRARVRDDLRDLGCRARREVGPLPPELHAWDLERANMSALLAYVPDRAYPGRITLFRARDQLRHLYPDPALGWSGWADEVEIIEVSGRHDDIVEQPVLHARLRTCLDRAIR